MRTRRVGGHRAPFGAIVVILGFISSAVAADASAANCVRETLVNAQLTAEAAARLPHGTAIMLAAPSGPERVVLAPGGTITSLCRAFSTQAVHEAIQLRQRLIGELAIMNGGLLTQIDERDRSTEILVRAMIRQRDQLGELVQELAYKEGVIAGNEVLIAGLKDAVYISYQFFEALRRILEAGGHLGIEERDQRQPRRIQ